MREIRLKEINDKDEFWAGATFRKVGTTLNNIKPEENYYEYVLFLDLGDSSNMLCAHIDKWERGTVVSKIATTRALDRYTVTALEFKKSMVLPEEIDSWYFIESEIRETRLMHK